MSEAMLSGIAGSLLSGIAGSLLKNLGFRALDEIASAQGFKTDLDKLKNTVNTIQDGLLNAEERQFESLDWFNDAEERQFESRAVRFWLDRLNDVLYAADDLFDKFATVASQREAMGKVHTLFSGSNHISREIKKIREELDDIVKYISQFGFVRRSLEEGRLPNRVRGGTCSYVYAKEVIGREDDREAIIGTLMTSYAGQERGLSVLPIVGIGGLGKTTLAQLIYNDERVQKNFELKLWVWVSEVFDLKEIMKTILRKISVTGKESQNLELEQLQGQVKREIGGKKYFLVLDDVWNENRLEWLKLSDILEVGGEGSVILVTTQSRQVADIMGTLPAHNLKGLSEEKSWALFEKMAFKPGESEKNPNLVKLGKEMVKKCGAVPLALVFLGSLLFGKDEQNWASIAERNFIDLPCAKDYMMSILKRSYHHLPSPLKKCFAYCALFPKDYNFHKETLINLWMAEGFVDSADETQSLKEVGEEYLMLLLQRCFFQDITRDEWGNISSFKMHDLMHDLALEVAGTGSKMAKFQDKNFCDKIHHLSFDDCLKGSWEIPTSMLKVKHLRSFLYLKQFQVGSNFKSEVLQQLISNFKCLRVLSLSDLEITTLPDSIGKLIHLRYLDLSWNPIEELPNSITKLQNLQTLILNFCLSLRALPLDTRKLTNLRTLDVEGCWKLSYMPGLGELTSLHKLPLFVVKGKTSPELNPATTQLRELQTLNNLSGSLTIVLCGELEDPASEAKEANLIAKHGLTNLCIDGSNHDWDWGNGSNHDWAIGNRSNHDEALLEGLKPHQNLKKLKIWGYRGQKLPSWAVGDSLCMTLPNLVEIRLFDFSECREVPCFSQLPFLKCLSLESIPNVEYMEMSPLHEDESTRTFFPSLQELVLNDMYNLKGWWEEAKVVDCSDEEQISQPSTNCHPLSLSLYSLAKLRIADCRCLVSFPLAPNVKDLELPSVNKELRLLKELTSSRGSSMFKEECLGYVGSLMIQGSKLRELKIYNVEVLISMPVECLGQLTSLWIRDTKLKNSCEVEEVFKHLSSLISLTFYQCESLASLEWIGCLSSLEDMRLSNCPGLRERCREPDGADWPYIRHIKKLTVW